MTDREEGSNIFKIAAEFTNDAIDTVVPVTDGSINQTFEVTTKSGDVFILQGMSHIFKPEILENLQAVQPILKASGVNIPECIPANDGSNYVADNERWYRALGYIPGVTIHNGISLAGTKSAAQLIGSFHNALVDCEVEIVEPIKHFHDTDHYMNRLARVADRYRDTDKYSNLSALGQEIIERYQIIKETLVTLPTRVIHGDLKVSNIRFDEDMKAVALIDMDVLMKSTIRVDMGDALRSWCGTAGEDNSNQVFDKEVFDAAMSGYQETAVNITDAEIASIPEGIRLLALELAARFLTDAYEENYFAKSSKYQSLYEQNKTRAENQMRFLKVVEASGIL